MLKFKYTLIIFEETSAIFKVKKYDLGFFKVMYCYGNTKLVCFIWDLKYEFMSGQQVLIIIAPY